MTDPQSNPYCSPNSTSGPPDPEQVEPLGCFGTFFLANVIGLGVAVIVAEALTFFCLMPPMNQWFSMNGEFDGMILIGMPVIVGGFSLITANIQGALFPRKFSTAVSISVAVFLVAFFFWESVKTARRPSDWLSAFTVSGILFTALAVGSLSVRKGLEGVNRSRAQSQSETTPERKQTIPEFGVITLTIAWSAMDVVLLWMIFHHSSNFWLLPISLFGLAYGLGALVCCAYQSVSRPEIRAIALACLSLILISLFLTFYLWLRIVWLR